MAEKPRDIVIGFVDVLGEAIDDPAERIGVEEENRSVHHSIEHGVVEGVADVERQEEHTDGLDEGSHNNGNHQHTEDDAVERVRLVGQTLVDPIANEEPHAAHHQCRSQS